MIYDHNKHVAVYRAMAGVLRDHDRRIGSLAFRGAIGFAVVAALFLLEFVIAITTL